VSKVAPGSAVLTITTEVENETPESQTCQVLTSIFDVSAKAVAKATSSPLTIATGRRTEVRQQVTIKGPSLWSIEAPNLYQAVSIIASNGTPADGYRTSFGIRSIRFDPNRGFFLNDKPVKIKGTCNHQDFAGLGVALPDRIHFFRVEKLKQMGANGYRMSHNPPTPALLDACDRLGMLVMDETRMMSSTPEGLDELATMIRRDRNHPSVIIWSIGNEEPLQGTETGAHIAASMKRLIRRLDPTRPMTEAMNDDWGKGLSRIVDVQGFNYHKSENMDAFHRQFPNQPAIGTETASTVCTRGIYENDKIAGYVSAYDLNVPSWAQLAEYWWEVYAQRPWLSGGFAWTGFDYRGEPTPYSWPCISSHFGIMDTCGFPKDNYYYYQAWWSDKPVLHLFPHWNWAGEEGSEIDVWCYSNLEEVELFLNGHSLGRKKVPQYLHVAWKVKFTPGILEARAYTGGGHVLTDRRETTEAAEKLALIPDRHIITADGQDACVIQVQVLDRAGRLVPTADSPIEFRITGSGRLIGVGNGDPSSHESDKSQRRRSFNGMCAAVVQSDGNVGQLGIEAKSPGMSAAKLLITCAAERRSRP
jgi:beta-galactosidase